ncbi:MAG: polyhydroxyalkanoate synthesis repressor PhaR [Hyphomicrobiaceae bacterium]|nr:polyhydroxyalkanoate synthesis repressor PhaR [Hyphomicrobiaceae bacterium]
MAEKGKGGDGPITIKKYANRRLYNTATSSYVTLDHLCQMVKDDVDFAVYDAKTGEDITRSVLTQIIVEEEAKGQNLLPIKFLRQLIGLYGDSMQWMVPEYLDQVMEAFTGNQERMRQSMQETFGGMFPFGNLEEMSRQNMALFENAMRIFAPPKAEPGPAASPDSGANADSDAGHADNGAQAPGEADSLEALRAQVDLLQKQLDAFSKGSSKD